MTMDNGMDVSPSWEELMEERDALAEERQGLRKVIAKLGAENREIRREADALSAHVERWQEWLGRDPEDDVDDWMDEGWAISKETPATSLARLKAQAKAEAFENLSNYAGHWTQADMRAIASDYRRQAEEGVAERQAEGDHP